jgi:hypothetical protein
MESNMETSLFELQVDHEATIYLKEAARWAKFLAILGFIFCGIFALAGLFAGSLIASMYSSAGLGRGGAVGGAFYSVIYLLIALLYFFPCLYTYNFGRKAQIALRSNDQVQLNQSFKNLKACYRFLGILTIIWLGLCLLGLVFAIIGLAFR